MVLLLFRSEAQTGDSLEYARSIRSGADLFHPHHLLFNPVIRAVWTGMKVFRPGADPIEAAQAHNIFWALVTLAAVFGIVRRMTGSAGAWPGGCRSPLTLRATWWQIAGELREFG